MLFCSQAFLIFFLVVFCLYWSMPWPRPRVWLLLIASFVFYATWNKWLAILICVSTVCDYYLARGLDHWKQPRVRRTLLLISLIGNLGMLCYFKYANFFLQSVEQGVRSVGGTVSLPVLQIILPIGISFYTFEAINYMVDVYRRKLPAERNLAHFMLFITFFPHLVAGPIVRARDFLPQIRRPKRWDWPRMQLGIEYMLMGLVKKVAIADRLSAFVDPVYAAPGTYQTHTIWIAVFAYALQLFCDFSGYSDMAIGAAHMLGYKLAQNFNMPYLASSIADLWRRWHISLSSWLRDYLYIPLGGSRAGHWKTARNLLVVMIIAGLWHGASWHWVTFGFVQGILLVGHRYFREFTARLPRLQSALNSWVGHACCVALTFMAFSTSLVFARASTLADAGIIFRRMFVPCGGVGTPGIGPSALLYTYIVVAICHWLACRPWWKSFRMRLPAYQLGAAYCLMLLTGLLLEPKSGQVFIYFQF
jgi:alginate O-acetyltransferase complex protein AlgI